MPVTEMQSVSFSYSFTLFPQEKRFFDFPVGNVLFDKRRALLQKSAPVKSRFPSQFNSYSCLCNTWERASYKHNNGGEYFY